MRGEVLSPRGRFGPLASDHPMVGTECIICGRPIEAGQAPSLVEWAPAGFEDAAKAQVGAAHNVEAKPAHEDCAWPGCPHCGFDVTDIGATGLDLCGNCGGLSRGGKPLQRETDYRPRPVEGRHALFVGWICGLAIKQGLPMIPVANNDGRYTDTLELSLEPTKPGRPRIAVRVIVPPPPDDWTLVD